MRVYRAIGAIWVLFSVWGWGAQFPDSHVDVVADLTTNPIELSADWTLGGDLENPIFFDFQPGVCAIDVVRVNGDTASWEQDGNHVVVTVNSLTNPTVVSFQWHAAPGANTDGIRKRDADLFHSVTAIGTPSGPTGWLPVPAETATDSRVTGSLSLILPNDMDGVATGTLVSDTPVASGHEVRFEISRPVFDRDLFFSVATGRQITTATLSTSSGNRSLVFYPYPGLQQECETDLAPILTLVPMLEQWFGDFPDNADSVLSACVMDFDQVVAPPGIVALGQGFITGEGTIDTRLANGLAGQWWGIRFPVYDPAHSWVTEGLRTYAEVMVSAQEAPDTGERFQDRTADILTAYDLGGTTLEGPLVSTNGDPYSHPYVLTAKGAYTLHMLRYAIGDASFFDGLKRLVELDSHANATNRLQFALEKETRLPLGSFLKQWTNRAPRPVFQYRFDQEDRRSVLDISQPDPVDHNGPFTLPLPVVQGDTNLTVWLTEREQRFYLPDAIGTPALDPHGHILKLAVANCPPLDAPDLSVTVSADATSYPFRLIPVFQRLPEGKRAWRIDGIPVTPAGDGTLPVLDPGAHTVQLTVSDDGHPAVSQALTIQLPQPDTDLNRDGRVNAADLYTVLTDPYADPIPNGTRDDTDISYLCNRLLQTSRNGESILPDGTATTDWQMTLQATSDPVPVGHTLPVTLRAHGPSALQLAVITLAFDPDHLAPLSVDAESGMSLLFSRVTGNRWLLVVGITDAGVDCAPGDGTPVFTARFRARQAADASVLQTEDNSGLFAHDTGTRVIPTPTRAEITVRNGTCRIPLLLNTDTWETSLGLIETGNAPDEVALAARDTNGVIVATAHLPLQPGQRSVRNVTDLFGDRADMASVEIVATGDIHAWAEYRQREQETAAACPATTDTDARLLVPHVSETPYWHTLTGIVNCGDTDAALTFSASGSRVTVNDTTPPGAGYHGRFIHLLDETLLQNGWGSFESTEPLSGAELFYRVDSLHQAAALRLSADTARRFYFPHIAVNGFWWTGISLINPTDQSASVRMEAFDEDGHAIPDTGDTIGTVHFSLPGQTRRVDLVEQFFDGRLDPRAAWIRVTCDTPLTGLEIFGSREGYTEDLAAGLEAVSEPSADLIFPWAIDGEQQQWSGLALLNPSDTHPADDITVTLYNANGTVVGLVALHLDPLQKHVVLLRDLFNGAVPAGGTYLRVHSDLPLVGFELTGDDHHQWLMGLNGI